MNDFRASGWSAVLVGAALCFAVAARADGGSISGQLVAKEARYRANAVVYVDAVAGEFKPTTAQVNQVGTAFEPRVLPIIKGTTVEFLNSDPVEHNVYSPNVEKYDLGNWGKGEKRTYTFKQAGVYTQLCKLHSSMMAHVVVLENPYFAVTGEDGAFAIQNVPPGKYTLKVWHERRQADPLEVSVEAGKAAKVEIEIHR